MDRGAGASCEVGRVKGWPVLCCDRERRSRRPFWGRVECEHSPGAGTPIHRGTRRLVADRLYPYPALFAHTFKAGTLLSHRQSLGGQLSLDFIQKSRSTWSWNWVGWGRSGARDQVDVTVTAQVRRLCSTQWPVTQAGASTGLPFQLGVKKSWPRSQRSMLKLTTKPLVLSMAKLQTGFSPR